MSLKLKYIPSPHFEEQAVHDLTCHSSLQCVLQVFENSSGFGK